MATYIQIGSTVTVGSGGASSIDFTSIPATYTDLVLKLSARSAASFATTQSITMQFNASTSGYSSKNLRGNGTAASSVADVYGTDEMYLGEMPATDATASTFGNGEIYIPNYAGSNNKSVSTDITTENNATLSWSYLTAALWANSAAITSIKLIPNAGNFVQYSTATLYGIKNS